MVYLNFQSVLGRPCYIHIQLAYSKKLIEGIYRTGAKFVLEGEVDEAEAA